jgi:hypothetical protein
VPGIHLAGARESSISSTAHTMGPLPDSRNHLPTERPSL